MASKLDKLLFSPTDISVVSIFRIVFGAFMVYQTSYYFSIDYAHQFMSGPEFLFSYEGLEFIRPMSHGVLKVINIGMIVAAVLITIGFLYRYATVFFFLGFSYFTLIDKTIYNNHLYLIMLLALVLIFIPAANKYSIKALLSKKTLARVVPSWNQYLLAFLIGLPYFFGGIAKLSPNWLSTNLVKEIVSSSQSSFLTELFPQNILIGFLKYGGLIYDLGIVFLLFYKKTRWLGLALVVIFNLSNHSILFNDIGLFPFLMIASTILFFDAQKVGSFTDKMLRRIGLVITKNQAPPATINTSSLVKGLVLAFVVFQLVFPLRHHFLTSNPEWTGVAQRFSWRMKLQSKNLVVFNMQLVDQTGAKSVPVQAKTFVTANQYIHLVEDPFNLIALSKYISKQATEKGVIENAKVFADVQLIFNSKQIQPLCDTSLDLTTINASKINNEAWIKQLR
ncbi:MAG: HTTM domain-containing protein [Gilvibacter sp.]